MQRAVHTSFCCKGMNHTCSPGATLTLRMGSELKDIHRHSLEQDQLYWDVLCWSAGVLQLGHCQSWGFRSLFQWGNVCEPGACLQAKSGQGSLIWMPQEHFAGYICIGHICKLGILGVSSPTRLTKYEYLWLLQHFWALGAWQVPRTSVCLQLGCHKNFYGNVSMMSVCILGKMAKGCWDHGCTSTLHWSG